MDCGFTVTMSVYNRPKFLSIEEFAIFGIV